MNRLGRLRVDWVHGDDRFRRFIATSPSELGRHLFGLAHIIGLHAAIVLNARSKLERAPLYTQNLANGG